MRGIIKATRESLGRKLAFHCLLVLALGHFGELEVRLPATSSSARRDTRGASFGVSTAWAQPADDDSEDPTCSASCKMTCSLSVCQGIVDKLVSDALAVTTTEELQKLMYNITYQKKYNVEEGFYPFVFTYQGVCAAHGQNEDFVNLALGEIVTGQGGQNASGLNSLFINAASADAITHLMTYTWGVDQTIKASYLLELKTGIPDYPTQMYVGSGFYVVNCPKPGATTTTTLPGTTTTRPDLNVSTLPGKYCTKYSDTLTTIPDIENAGISPTGLFLDNSGDIYFLGTDSSLYKFSAILGISQLVAGLNQPFEVAIDPADLGLLITCATAIYKLPCLSKNWGYFFCELYDDTVVIPLSLQLTVAVQNIRGMAVTHSSSIFFVDSGTGGLYFHNTKGTTLTTQLLTGLSQPYDVAHDPNTFDLFISDIGTAAVYRLRCVNAGSDDCIDYASQSALQVWVDTMQVYSLRVTDNSTVIIANSNSRSIIETRNIAADATATPQVVIETLSSFQSATTIPKWFTMDRQTCNIYATTVQTEAAPIFKLPCLNITGACGGTGIPASTGRCQGTLVGSTCAETCRTGFHRESSSLITCFEDTAGQPRWSGLEDAHCYPDSCSTFSTTLIANSDPESCTGVNSSQSCVPSCLPGFHLDTQDGDGTAPVNESAVIAAAPICSRGSWAASSLGNLYCLPNPCDALSAEDIDAIEESEEVWDLCENWPSSVQCKYICSEGYVQTDSPYVTCVKGNWTKLDAAACTNSASAWTFVAYLAVGAAGVILVIVGIVIIVVFLRRKKRSRRLSLDDRGLIARSNSHKQLNMPLVVTALDGMEDMSGSEGDVLNLASPLSRLKFQGPNTSGLIIGNNEVRKLQRIGAGAAGQVFEGRFNDSEVALKEIYQHLMNGDIDAVSKEARILASLRHPNIVTFYGMWEHLDVELKQWRVYLVLELCKGGDLGGWIDDPKNADVPLAPRMEWLVQIAQAMKFLHSKEPPILHRDLKPCNVLLDGHGQLKICDFGISVICDETKLNMSMTSNVGTISFMPPEAMSLERMVQSRTSRKWDVYSFGILSSVLLTGKHPYAGLAAEQVYVGVCLHGTRPELPDELKEYATELITKCWAREPEDRPDFSTIVSVLQNKGVSVDHHHHHGGESVGSESDEYSTSSTPRQRQIKRFSMVHDADGNVSFETVPDTADDDNDEEEEEEISSERGSTGIVAGGAVSPPHNDSDDGKSKRGYV